MGGNIVDADVDHPVKVARMLGCYYYSAIVGSVGQHSGVPVAVVSSVVAAAAAAEVSFVLPFVVIYVSFHVSLAIFGSVLYKLRN